MTVEHLTRRTFLRRTSGLLTAVTAGLVLHPHTARAEGHSAFCGAPFGPLHQYLYETSPDPLFADAVIWRESRWSPGAYNPSSGATGLAQFIPSTWRWGSERFGTFGDPWNPYDNMDLMSNFLAEGEYYHWDL